MPFFSPFPAPIRQNPDTPSLEDDTAAAAPLIDVVIPLLVRSAAGTVSRCFSGRSDGRRARLLRSVSWLLICALCGSTMLQTRQLTFWNRLIALTTAINASSTFTRCLADVSIHWALKRLARSRPSDDVSFPIHVVMLRWIRGRAHATQLTMRLDLTFVFEVALVGDDNNGEVILVLDLVASACPILLGRCTQDSGNSPEGSVDGTSRLLRNCSETL